ncbi:MAG: Zn-ribbon domain-containing OB-fold protein [Acidimicrobiia bacterium]
MVPRMLPALTEENTPFWTGGGSGHLLIQRCVECRKWQHPPQRSCAACGSAVAPEPVSGRANVFTFTINDQPFHPEVPPPYVIALVELVEQADLRLPTNIVGCDPAAVHIGMPVHVEFEAHGGVHVPVFAPAPSVGVSG